MNSIHKEKSMLTNDESTIAGGFLKKSEYAYFYIKKGILSDFRY